MPAGYDERAPRPAGQQAVLITAPSSVEILRPEPGDIVTIQDGRS